MEEYQRKATALSQVTGNFHKYPEVDSNPGSLVGVTDSELQFCTYYQGSFWMAIIAIVICNNSMGILATLIDHFDFNSKDTRDYLKHYSKKKLTRSFK